jgi:hypothetical protein
MSYLICADAGNIGSVAHIKYLVKQKQRTLISFKADRDNSGKHHLLTKILNSDLALHE